MAEAALSQRMSARRCSSRSCASFGGVAPVMLTAPSAGITFQGQREEEPLHSKLLGTDPYTVR